MRWRRLNTDLHRDIGFFLSGLIFVYCLSGLALNHVHDWNPDFIIEKRSLTLEHAYTAAEITPERIKEISALVGETQARVHDFPTPDRLKIYYDNASLLVDLPGKTAEYESVHRRPLFYQVNVLHRNSLKGWRWASDIFSVLLMFLTASGWFMLRGKYGFMGRGKWLVLAGFVPPIAAFLIFQMVQK